MNLRIHDNGWTVIIEDWDIKQATQEEINTIGKYVASNIVVVVKQQDLSVEDECRLMHMFGEVENSLEIEDQEPWSHFLLPKSNAELIRVTGELDEHGEPGMFGHVSDLDWHCNRPGQPTRMPIVWLYGVKGTKGSRTSWSNGVMAYNDADPEFLEEIKDLKMICGFKQGGYTEINFGKQVDFNEYYHPPVVHENTLANNRKSIFFPYLQFKHFVGMTEEETLPLLEKIRDYVLQEKYIYHHDWDDGDIVISDQTEALHKRWRFEEIANRTLHRGTFNLSNIKF